MYKPNTKILGTLNTVITNLENLLAKKNEVYHKHSKVGGSGEAHAYVRVV